MKTIFISSLIWMICLDLVSAQTGMYSMTEPYAMIPARTAIRANDGNYIVEYGKSGNIYFEKMTPDGEILWETHMGCEAFEMRTKIFAVPGEGYYCITNKNFCHLAEDGTLLTNTWYTSTGLGYDGLAYIGIWFFAHDIYFSGTYFDIIFSLPGNDGSDNSVLLRIDKSGNILINHMTNMDATGIGSKMQLTSKGPYNYLIYQTSHPGYEDSLLIVKIDTTDFSSETFSIYPSFEPEGIIKQDDGILIYGEAPGYFWDDTLTTCLLKWNFADSISWQNRDTIVHWSSDLNKLQFLTQLVDGNYTGVYGYSISGFPDTIKYQLITFDSSGHLLIVRPRFYQTYYNSYIGLFDMQPDNDDQFVFAGTNSIDGSTAYPFMMVADTAGNYFHLNITGRLYHDANGNGVFDTGEVAFHDKLLHTASPAYYAMSNSSGEFNMIIGNTGDQTLYTDSVLYWDIIQPSDHYDFSADSTMTMDTLTGYDFLYDYSVPVHEVSMSVHQGSVTPGFETYSEMTIENIGNQYGESGSAFIHFPSQLNFTGCDPAYTAYSDTTLQWLYNGLDPFLPVTISADYVTDISASIGDTIAETGNIVPDILDFVAENNYDSLSIIVCGAWDPNHLTAEPAGTGAEGAIDVNTQWLTYTIDFQNLGNAPAININVYDTLPELLDISSLEMISSSDEYTLYLNADGILHWRFDSIMLPDSAADFTGSMGYITFRVRIKEIATAGDVIINQAQIYFDFNEPVATNITTNTLTAATSLNNIESDHSIMIYPNPATEGFWISGAGLFQSAYQLQVFNPEGRLLLTKNITDGNASVFVNVKELPAGLYFVELRNQSVQMNAKVLLLDQ